MKSLFQIVVLGLVSLSTVSVEAQTLEKVVLKNGSVLEGYLSEQRLGLSFTVNSTKAVLFANEDSLLQVKQEAVKLTSLSRAWQEWAKNSGNVAKNADGTILMSTIQFDHITIPNVFVQERGVTIKYVDLNERTYVFPWNQLSMTSKNLRPANQFSGIIDELVMKNGNHYEGQVTDQTPGKGIKLILDDGSVQSFNYSDIAQIISKPLNAKMTIWEQSQLLDEVVVKNSGETIQGIITSRHIGKDYVFAQKNGQTRVVQAKDVAIFRKCKNQDYKSMQDRSMAVGEILINGDAKNAYFCNLEATDSYILLNQREASMQASCGDTIVVEACLDDPSANVKVAKAQVRDVQTINAKGKKVMQRKSVVMLGDLLQSKKYGTKEITPLGHIKYTLPLTESGDYVMQIDGKSGYIVVYVPKNADK